MTFQSELEIRYQLVRFIADRMPLAEFEDWFIPRSWDFKAGPQSLQEIVAEIELRLAEYSNGDWNMRELKNKLMPLVTRYSIEYRTDDDSPRISTGVSARESRPDLTTSADISLAMAYG